MCIEEYIISVYCILDDLVKKNPEKLRKRGRRTRLTDAEVITMEVVGEFLGLHCDNRIHQYFRTYWAEWFPGMGSRTAFARQAANLWGLKQWLCWAIAGLHFPDGVGLSVVDGLPMPLCNLRRAPRCRLFRGEAAYGHCAAKDMRYYGFKGHVLTSDDGFILAFGVAAANVDERAMLLEMSASATPYVLGDKGYLCSDTMEEELLAEGVKVIAPVRENMADPLSPELRGRLNARRRIVETVNAQLAGRLEMERIWARDRWHLTARVARKVLAHNLNCYLNKLNGRRPLLFSKLITVA